MMAEPKEQHVFNKYLRNERLPHIWCAGCGIGTGVNSFIRSVDQLGINQDEIVIVSGIGCSGRASAYMDFCGFHPPHGRSLAFATGVKHYKPHLTVVAIMGDGDGASIGGNHLIHAARRNINITALFFNNNNYGMTGGQYSPTTPLGSKTSTSPYGHLEAPFDACKLVEAAGATYIARGTVYHVKQLTTLMTEAIRHKGFSFVEIMCQCPTLYGRFNKKGNLIEMLEKMRDMSISVKAAEKLTPDEIQEKIIIGKLVHKERPEYSDEYAKMLINVKKGEKA
jgi:2-oxoglutarate/2-oxoacid ferredoxin oxidoreductase subunit beta